MNIGEIKRKEVGKYSIEIENGNPCACIVRKSGDIIEEFTGGSVDSCEDIGIGFIQEDIAKELSEESKQLRSKVECLLGSQIERYALVAKKSLHDVYSDLMSSMIQFSYNNLAESISVGNFTISRKHGKVTITFKTEL